MASNPQGSGQPLPETVDHQPIGPDPDERPPPGEAEMLRSTAKPNGEEGIPIRVRLPGYEVLELLGKGGMGVVYKARQTSLNRVVALKMILHAEHAGPAERQRFQTEAEAAARLQHPNIVQVFEVGTHEGLPYLTLEYCPGGSLVRQLDGAPWPIREAVQLVETLAVAVQAAHSARVVHRDLKPANVLLTANGQPKIADFGLAKKLGEPGQTQTGEVVGTPSYMSPEQAGGKAKEVGPATDIYALGAILYELLTGRPPFKAATQLDTLLQVVTVEPTPARRLRPEVPRDLETICHKCLEKEPARRYGSAESLAEDLRLFLAGEPIRVRRISRWERGMRWMRRRPAVVVAATASVAALVCFIVLFAVLWLNVHAPSTAPTVDTPKRTSRLPIVRTRFPSSDMWESKLKQIIDYGVEDPRATLDEVLADLAKKFGLKFEIDDRAFEWDQLAEVGRSPITDKAPLPKMHASIAEVIEKILKRVPARSGACYQTRNDHILITPSPFQRVTIESTVESIPLWELLDYIVDNFGFEIDRAFTQDKENKLVKIVASKDVYVFALVMRILRQVGVDPAKAIGEIPEILRFIPA